MTTLHRRTGFEIELLAPRGTDRRLLADRVASAIGGSVVPMFHTDSEPSLVPGMGHFWHLTPGAEVLSADGESVASFVDDITIVADLEGEHATRALDEPRTDRWYRLLSDDDRLLRLVAAHADPGAPLDRVLDEAAVLFRTKVERVGPYLRLRDSCGASVAMAAPLVPGRDRPCEVVTAPLVAGHLDALEALLAPARKLGFSVPYEAAVHLHVDGDPFRNTPAFANLVRLFGHWREALRVALSTNPACTRLRPLPPALTTLVDEVDQTTPWSVVQERAAETGLTKFFDVNLTALLTDEPMRNTIEVRVLPGALRGEEIVERAGFVERLLDRCEQVEPIPAPTTSDPEWMYEELLAMMGGVSGIGAVSRG